MKFLVILLVVIIIIGGAVIGMGFAGVLNIPGITPPKKKPEVVDQTTDDAPIVNETQSEDSLAEKAIEPSDKRHEERTPPPVIRPAKDGTERLAKLWSDIDPTSLIKIIEKYGDSDLLPVLAKMDDEKLAKVLAALPPERAAVISRGIKALEKGGK
jgi:flagellar motility protein MotE (MotC chaperone)